MKVTYLGTGAAEGIPALFCNCEYCKRERAAGRMRSRSQVLIDELSVDFPPDSFYHAAKFGVDFSAIRYILVSHSHTDHCYAHDFILRGYKYAANMTEPNLDIFMNAESAQVYLESTRREMREEIAQTIVVHEIGSFQELAFGEFTVHTLKASHTSREPLLFLIEKAGKRILHLHDTGALSQETYEYLATLNQKPCDLITLDCTFLWDETSQNARHMGLDENARTLERLKELGFVNGVTKKVITHFSHNSRPTEERLRRAEETFGVIAAYDGMTMEL